jgi:transcriptional regulator with XRE-family HTH domain
MGVVENWTTRMIVGDRLRALREEKKFSQRQIARRSGLKGSYISRAEHGHSIPSIRTLQKWARALGVPLHRVFYDENQDTDTGDFAMRTDKAKGSWSASGKDARAFKILAQLFSRMSDNQREVILHLARQMTNQNKT